MDDCLHEEGEQGRDRSSILAAALREAALARDEGLCVSLLDLGAKADKVAFPLDMARSKGGSEPVWLADIAGQAAARGMPRLLERALRDGAGRGAEHRSKRKDGREIGLVSAIRALATREGGPEEMEGRLECLSILAKEGIDWEEPAPGERIGEGESAAPLRSALWKRLGLEAEAMVALGCPLDVGMSGRESVSFWPWEIAGWRGMEETARALAGKASDEQLRRSARDWCSKVALALRAAPGANAGEIFGKIGSAGSAGLEEARARGLELGLEDTGAAEELGATRGNGGFGLVAWEPERAEGMRESLRRIAMESPAGALALSARMRAPAEEILALARETPIGAEALGIVRRIAFPKEPPSGWMELEAKARMEESLGPAIPSARAGRPL